MSSGDKLTKKQHYIPQVYLRGFSIDDSLQRSSKNDNEKARIHYYELTHHKFYTNIPIKTICYEYYLYEITDDNGNQVLPNYLEKKLGYLERQFTQYRKELKGKAFIEENYKTKTFLTHDEKIFWITYISTQLMRSPTILKLAAQTGKDILKDEINVNQAKNLALSVCLPFFNELKEGSIETKLWDIVMGPMLSMSFAICVDKEARFITSDSPVYIYTRTFPCDEYEKIVFPVSSELCIILLGGEEKKGYDKNFLFPISEEVRKMVFGAMVDNALDKIFLNHMINNLEKSWIKEVMRDKAK